MHWTCAYQQAHCPNNPRAAHDARLLISFAIRVWRQLPATRLKTVPHPATTPHNSPANSPPVQ